VAEAAEFSHFVKPVIIPLQMKIFGRGGPQSVKGHKDRQTHRWRDIQMHRWRERLIDRRTVARKETKINIYIKRERWGNRLTNGQINRDKNTDVQVNRKTVACKRYKERHLEKDRERWLDRDTKRYI
jgi:hypothetical protein